MAKNLGIPSDQAREYIQHNQDFANQPGWFDSILEAYRAYKVYETFLWQTQDRLRIVTETYITAYKKFEVAESLKPEDLENLGDDYKKDIIKALTEAKDAILLVEKLQENAVR